MSFLKKFFNRASTPPAKSRVKGFSLSVQKKDGALLTTKPKNDPNEINNKNFADHTHPVSEEYYFEAKVASNGQNPEYPDKFEDWTFRFTVARPELSRQGCGFINSAAYIPAGSRWTKFELTESFYDANKVIQTGNFRPPSHHSVNLNAHYETTDGKKNQLSVGGEWVRESERNSQAWRDAKNDKTFWL